MIFPPVFRSSLSLTLPRLFGEPQCTHNIRKHTRLFSQGDSHTIDTHVLSGHNCAGFFGFVPLLNLGVRGGRRVCVIGNEIGRECNFLNGKTDGVRMRRSPTVEGTHETGVAGHWAVYRSHPRRQLLAQTDHLHRRERKRV